MYSFSDGPSHRETVSGVVYFTVLRINFVVIKFFYKVIPMQAQRVGTSIALLFHDRGTRRG